MSFLNLSESTKLRKIYSEILDKKLFSSPLPKFNSNQGLQNDGINGSEKFQRIMLRRKSQEKLFDYFSLKQFRKSLSVSNKNVNHSSNSLDLNSKDGISLNHSGEAKNKNQQDNDSFNNNKKKPIKISNPPIYKENEILFMNCSDLKEEKYGANIKNEKKLKNSSIDNNQDNLIDLNKNKNMISSVNPKKSGHFYSNNPITDNLILIPTDSKNRNETKGKSYHDTEKNNNQNDNIKMNIKKISGSNSNFEKKDNELEIRKKNLIPKGKKTIDAEQNLLSTIHFSNLNEEKLKRIEKGTIILHKFFQLKYFNKLFQKRTTTQKFVLVLTRLNTICRRVLIKNSFYKLKTNLNLFAEFRQSSFVERKGKYVNQISLFYLKQLKKYFLSFAHVCKLHRLWVLNTQNELHLRKKFIVLRSLKLNLIVNSCLRNRFFKILKISFETLKQNIINTANGKKKSIISCYFLYLGKTFSFWRYRAHTKLQLIINREKIKDRQILKILNLKMNFFLKWKSSYLYLKEEKMKEASKYIPILIHKKETIEKNKQGFLEIKTSKRIEINNSKTMKH